MIPDHKAQGGNDPVQKTDLTVVLAPKGTAQAQGAIEMSNAILLASQLVTHTPGLEEGPSHFLDFVVPPTLAHESKFLLVTQESTNELSSCFVDSGDCI
mmetsp:Transcript_824/g.2364  ORF Transcript_824/g.2364 Transcript_824/m.2364 type:complete len:99 (-) Transcript_824:293-589(-)